ncbi:MAG: 2OG-Fe(II) oxygenase [Sphingobacteriales bacterium]|nr:2OG-Fe(II) oxygenase [Sphingobacteriales bacterium]
MNLINTSLFTPSNLAQMKSSFAEAKPYKHLVIDGILNPEFAEEIFAAFPKEEAFNKRYKGVNEFKAEGSNFEDFPAIFSQLKEAFHSKEWCEIMSEITGINELFSVPDALGGGLHQGGNGSFLDIHIDFNIHADRGIHRRVNLLIFFNKDWKEEYGGHTELWNADMTHLDKKVFPDFNRCLIFETNEISYHGYAAITVPENVSRKSFYAYYYTQLREDAVKYHDTVFKARPTDSTLKKTLTPIKENAKNFIKRQLRNLGITFK